ncbi:15491_t:CDS:1, partial [Acaulospora colombiana]
GAFTTDVGQVDHVPSNDGAGYTDYREDHRVPTRGGIRYMCITGSVDVLGSVDAAVSKVGSSQGKAVSS